MTITRNLRVGAAAAIGVVLLNTWLASHALGTLFSAQRWQAHTLDVISQTKNLVVLVRVADSAARGYMLTGNPLFEDRFHTAEQALPAKLGELQQLTADNASQQQRIAYLRGRIAAKMTALETGLHMRHGHMEGGIDPAILGPVLSDSPDGMASVPYCITQIEGEEQRLLNMRSGETGSARRQVVISFTAASILDVLLLVAAFELLVRAQRARQQLASDAERIEQLNVDLTTLNSDLETRVEQRTRELEVSNRELEAFSYSVSHDLRAPLRTIDGFSLALQEDFADKLNDEGRDYILRVRNGVQRMGSLIDALLQLSRVTRGDIQREKVDMSTLSTLVFNELQAASPERSVIFVAQPGVIADADPRLVRITFENLIGNAFKFTSRTENAQIEFGCSEDNGRVVYFIRDNGAGFDMQYVDRLFTAFQRLHGDRDFKGSGIGLATVSRIIRRHHGDIRAEGEIGKGAAFYFTLDA